MAGHSAQNEKAGQGVDDIDGPELAVDADCQAFVIWFRRFGINVINQE